MQHLLDWTEQPKRDWLRFDWTEQQKREMLRAQNTGGVPEAPKPIHGVTESTKRPRPALEAAKDRYNQRKDAFSRGRRPGRR